MGEFMPKRTDHGGAGGQPLADGMDRATMHKSAGYPNDLVGPCRCERKHDALPVDYASWNWRRKLSHRFFDYLRNQCL